jgi:hypothetical protein
MEAMYKKPEVRTTILLMDRNFCLSNVPGIGGTTTDYEEDNENLNG